MNPTLRERIDKSIVGKLIKVKLISGQVILLNKNFKFTNELAEELYKPVTKNFREGEST